MKNQDPVTEGLGLGSVANTTLDFSIGRCSFVDQANLFLPGESLLSDIFPASKIAFFIFLNYILWCMEGEMRSNKSEVMKEGLANMIFLMVCQAFNCMVGSGGGGIVVFRCLLRIEWNVIELVPFGREEISLIIYSPGLMKAVG